MKLNTFPSLPVETGCPEFALKIIIIALLDIDISNSSIVNNIPPDSVRKMISLCISWRDYHRKSNIKLLNDDGNNLLAFGPELQIKIMEWATLTFKYSTMIRVTYIYTFHKKPNLTQSKMKFGK